MKKSLKLLLWVLVIVMSVLLVVVFISGGCRSSVTPVEEPEPNIALEIVELAKSQIGNLTGDGPFASLVWADSNYTYCDRFVSAVMAVVYGETLSEDYHSGYNTAYDDYIAHEGLIKSGEPPKGAVVYYGKHKENWDCGHVGISNGEGNIISVVDKERGVLSVPLKNFKAPLLGWITFKEYKSQEEVVKEEARPEKPEEQLKETEGETTVLEEEYPTGVGYVNDFAHIFSQEHLDKMDKLIRDLEERTTAEIVVVTINSLGEKSIEEYAFELFNSWEIGKKDKNNGILFLIAVKERWCRIEVGLGLEDTITNNTAQKIIDEIVIPRFKEKEYGLGSYECVKRISEIIISSSN